MLPRSSLIARRLTRCRCQGWFDLANAVTAAGHDPATRVVVLAAEGRGFRRRGGHQGDAAHARVTTALIGANRGCSAAFAAVYECAVPVIAAVHGFCLGGGIGLVGNADIVVACDDATFGLPEVDRGRARRGHPPGPARAAAPDARRWSTPAAPSPPQQLHALRRRCSRSCRASELREAALEVAARDRGQGPAVIRLAKESLNGIDPVDVKRSYRFEQGFTFELNLAGRRLTRHRDAFVGADEVTQGPGDKRDDRRRGGRPSCETA